MATAANWKKTFITIWVGQVVSLITSSIVQFSLVWYLTEQYKSASVLTTATLVGFLPMALFSPFIGSFIDRFDRKKIMVIADAAIALTTAVLAIIAFDGEMSVPMIYLVMFIRALGGAFHQPCLQAVTPLIVPKEALTKCNGYTSAFMSISNIISPAIAAALFAVVPISYILLLDLIGAFAGIFTIVISKIPELKKTKEQLAEKLHVVGDAVEGLRVLIREKGLFIFMILASVFSLAFIPMSSLYPLACVTWFGGTTTHAGVVEIGFAVGMLIGGVILGLWGGTKNKMTTIFASLFVIGAVSIGMGVLPQSGFSLFTVLTFILGFSAPFVNSIFMALIQEKIAPEYLGRVIGVTSSMQAIAGPIGLIITGVLAEGVGVMNWFVISGLVTVFCVVLGLLIPSVRKLDEKKPAAVNQTA